MGSCLRLGLGCASVPVLSRQPVAVERREQLCARALAERADVGASARLGGRGDDGACRADGLRHARASRVSARLPGGSGRRGARCAAAADAAIRVRRGGARRSLAVSPARRAYGSPAGPGEPGASPGDGGHPRGNPGQRGGTGGARTAALCRGGQRLRGDRRGGGHAGRDEPRGLGVGNGAGDDPRRGAPDRRTLAVGGARRDRRGAPVPAAFAAGGGGGRRDRPARRGRRGAVSHRPCRTSGAGAAHRRGAYRARDLSRRCLLAGGFGGGGAGARLYRAGDGDAVFSSICR